jgi:hypothetical protein
MKNTAALEARSSTELRSLDLLAQCDIELKLYRDRYFARRPGILDVSPHASFLEQRDFYRDAWIARLAQIVCRIAGRNKIQVKALVDDFVGREGHHQIARFLDRKWGGAKARYRFEVDLFGSELPEHHEEKERLRGMFRRCQAFLKNNVAGTDHEDDFHEELATRDLRDSNNIKPP